MEISRNSDTTSTTTSTPTSTNRGTTTSTTTSTSSNGETSVSDESSIRASPRRRLRYVDDQFHTNPDDVFESPAPRKLRTASVVSASGGRHQGNPTVWSSPNQIVGNHTTTYDLNSIREVPQTPFFHQKPVFMVDGTVELRGNFAEVRFECLFSKYI